MEFKGTKGKWRRSQNKTGDIEISGAGFDKLAIVNFYPEGFREKYINGKITGSPAPDSTTFRTECLYNALLISKAPEMLEILKKTIPHLPYLGILQNDIKQLIEEATEFN